MNFPPVITPNDHVVSHKTGSLSSKLTVDQISYVLGFDCNIVDDPDKVKHSWGASIYDTTTGQSFKVAIWDYNGARWSTYGDNDVLKELFPCSS